MITYPHEINLGLDLKDLTYEEQCQQENVVVQYKKKYETSRHLNIYWTFYLDQVPTIQCPT